MSYQTIEVEFQDTVCFIRFNRPEANNAINDCMIYEMQQVLAFCEESAAVVVFEGLPEVFCLGGDFQDIHDKTMNGVRRGSSPEQLYDLWLKIAVGPFVAVSYVRGRVNAGGMGFVAASDIVLADSTANFSLSELLFGLFPACVLPFLIRKIGFQKAHYLTLSTKPVNAEAAVQWGLVDACEEKKGAILRRHLLRLKCLSKKGIQAYKQYVNDLDDSLYRLKAAATDANRKLFADPEILKGISRYVEDGVFPWQDRH